MKKWNSKLKIKRTSTSPYFAPTFNELEKKALYDYGDFLENHSDILADVLITNTHTDFKSWNPKELSQLKLILHPNSGYDNFSEDFVQNFKGTIVVGNPIRAQAVADYILSALYNHYCQIPTQKKWSIERKWPRKLISELKITIVGFGHVGKILHHCLEKKIDNLCLYDPFAGHPHFHFKDRDVIILATSLNPTSYHLINDELLQSLPNDALIINAARGELINTQSLLAFLKTNPQAFAVLDVFEKEPANFSVFDELKNIILTSHIAGVYKNIDQKTIEFEKIVLKDFCNLTDLDFNSKYQDIILKNKIKKDIGLI